MTRQELYDLVWKEPLTHAAKRFGISDVALRKTCVKHNIPTPPLGYWAKVAHGKKGVQPALPQAKQDEHEWIRLEPSVTSVLPEDVSASLTTVRQQATTNKASIVVPKEKPEILHPIAKSHCQGTGDHTAQEPPRRHRAGELERHQPLLSDCLFNFDKPPAY
ncbi:MAG: hypothetical protein AB7S92_12580 [Parvibaculaceae bacterium]